MNMQNIMAQAQKVQKELEKANEIIENTTYVGKSGPVEVEMSGVPVVNKVTILDDSVLSDKELLQDMVIVAINDALLNLAKDKEEKLGKYTGGLGGLF